MDLWNSAPIAFRHQSLSLIDFLSIVGAALGEIGRMAGVPMQWTDTVIAVPVPTAPMPRNQPPTNLSASSATAKRRNRFLRKRCLAKICTISCGPLQLVFNWLV